MNDVDTANKGNPLSERTIRVQCVFLEISVHFISAVERETVRGINLGIHTSPVSKIGMINENFIHGLLSGIVESHTPSSSLESEGVVSFFADSSVQNFGEPPDTILVPVVLSTEKRKRHTF